MPMISLVTGGAGFIGSHLVDALLARGDTVRVLDDYSTGKRENVEHLWGKIELFERDVRVPWMCAEACEGVDVVYHQAALGSVPRSMAEPVPSFDVNVVGTAAIFDAARKAGVRRVVFASSSAVYGSATANPRREGEEGEPLSPYALSKRMDEELALLFGRCYGLEVVGLRYFNVYGPRQDPAGPYAAVVPRFVEACRAGEPSVIHGDGGQTRDFIFVADAVRANLLAAEASAETVGRSVNVCAGVRTSVLELLDGIRAHFPDAPEPRFEASRPGDIRHAQGDPELAAELIGFRAQVGLEQGLGATVASYGSSPGG